MTKNDWTRRRIVKLGTLTAAGAVIGACSSAGDDEDVGAVEDLMREHGVLRRALLVYAECAPKLRSDPASLDAAAINRAAKLFHDFGEEYHERKLEEAHIFPRVKKAGGAAADYIDVLLNQHQRGRELTSYFLNTTASGKVAASDAEALAAAFESFVRMYENHAAREDTIIFPAWKKALSGSELSELGEKFEDIEKQQFGGDGFEQAVKQIGDIEQTLGLADIAQFTAAAPPH